MATATRDCLDVYGATLTRRQFVKTGGALFVGFSLAGTSVLKQTVEAAGTTNSLDATLASRAEALDIQLSERTRARRGPLAHHGDQFTNDILLRSLYSSFEYDQSQRDFTFKLIGNADHRAFSYIGVCRQNLL